MTDSTPATAAACPHCAGRGYYFADGDEYVCVCAAGEAYGAPYDPEKHDD